MSKLRIAALAVGAAIFGGSLIACGGGSPSPSPTIQLSSPAITLSPTHPAPSPSRSTLPTPSDDPKSPPPADLTAEQTNAVGDAKDYLEYQAFSRDGLIEQLSSSAGDGYSKADATKAVDSLHEDWNQQAVRAAQDYLSGQHFSKKGLTEQLESRYGARFTHKQAVYGVAHSGL